MDDRSRYAEVVCLKSKDMVTQAVIDMTVEWERQTGQRIKRSVPTMERRIRQLCKITA
jgi:transcription initiation factor TFIIIB Brf1 subunit/transcription initiation factor TFIIB